MQFLGVNWNSVKNSPTLYIQGPPRVDIEGKPKPKLVTLECHILHSSKTPISPWGVGGGHLGESKHGTKSSSFQIALFLLLLWTH